MSQSSPTCFCWRSITGEVHPCIHHVGEPSKGVVTALSLDAAAARIEEAMAEVRALCAGRSHYIDPENPGKGAGRDWTMTIPVLTTDSDMVLTEALLVAQELLKRERLRVGT